MARRHDDGGIRPSRIENAPMEYAPVNEHGVVFLFAALAKRLGLRIESVKAGFPDCIAYQRTGKSDKRKRIEFEFRSSNFKTHGHDPRKCDWIVCWEHDWHSVPRNIQVVELRKEFGLGFNVWMMPVSDPYKNELSKPFKTFSWSVPGRASQGDLLLFYHTAPERYIKHIFKLEGPIESDKRWKYSGKICRVCKLEAPLFWEDLKRDRILSTASFVRGQMRGRCRATEFWPYLYGAILRKNPAVTKSLGNFEPSLL